jgi:hypothetical protein
MFGVYDALVDIDTRHTSVRQSDPMLAYGDTVFESFTLAQYHRNELRRMMLHGDIGH